MDNIDFTAVQAWVVYFIKFKSSFHDNVLFKIGITSNLDNRLVSLKNEFRITSDYKLLLSLEVRSIDIEYQLLDLFTSEFPSLKISFTARDTMKTECFIYDEYMLDLVGKVKERYINQTVGLGLEYKHDIEITDAIIKELTPKKKRVYRNKQDQDEWDKMISMKDDDNVSFDEYCNQVLIVYCKHTINNRKTVTITRNEGKNKKGEPIIRTMNRVTDHTKHPFNLLVKDKYSHEEVIKFINDHGIKSGSTKLAHLLKYTYKSQDTTIDASRIQKKTLTKLSKSDIDVRIEDNIILE